MQLGRVRGEVVATRRDPGLAGHAFRLLEPVDELGRPQGDLLVAVEVVAARTGDLVLWVDSREAPKALPSGHGAVDACIVGLVDAAC